MNVVSRYRMTERDKPFELQKEQLPELKEGEALVEVAGCGVCHTDLSFWHYGVPTRSEPPLALGHEISGIVTDGTEDIIGSAVIIPAVLPCGECELCKGGRGNICQSQKMPGNDFDGGFASHVVVPARYLCRVPEATLSGHSLAELSVIADAVTTPYQAVLKSGLKEGDFAVVIGVGGVGVYAAQIARTRGAKVLAIDISPEKLDMLSEAGIESTLNTSGMGVKEAKKRVKEVCREAGAPAYGWKVFEMSGTHDGQELAFALLGVAGTLSVVGFTMEKLELRLSNLMAFDAEAVGTWGCKPELYPDVLKLVAEGKVRIKPFTQLRPMSKINDIFTETLEGKHLKRTVLVPDFD